MLIEAYTQSTLQSFAEADITDQITLLFVTMSFTRILLVLSITPLKIEYSKPFNRLSPEFDKRKTVKTLFKIHVTAIFLVARYAEKRFTQTYRDLYGDAMLVPIRMGTNMAAENQEKHLSLSFATKV